MPRHSSKLHAQEPSRIFCCAVRFKVVRSSHRPVAGPSEDNRIWLDEKPFEQGSSLATASPSGGGQAEGPPWWGAAVSPAWAGPSKPRRSPIQWNVQRSTFNIQRAKRKIA